MTVNEVIKLNDQIIDVWNKHDIGAFDKYYDSNVVWKDTGSQEPYKGLQGAKDFYNNWLTAFPDLKINAVNKVASEDSIAVEVEFTGTNRGPLKVSKDTPEIPATNKVVASKGSYFAKFRNGKCIEVHSYPDLTGMMQQLGLMQEVMHG